MGKVVVANDAKFEEVYNAYVNNGNAPLTKFSGVGSTGDGNGFSEGDVISLPDDLSKAMIGMKIAGSERVAEALLCKVTSASGSVRYQPFFVKSMAKRTRVLKLDADKNVVDESYTKPDGTAAAWWQSNAGRDVQEIVKDLIAMDKDIKISKVKSEKTYRFNSTTEVVNTNVYTYDFV